MYKRYVKVGAGGRTAAGAACTCKSRSLGSNQCRGGRRRGNGGRKSERVASIAAANTVGLFVSKNCLSIEQAQADM